MTNTAMKHSFTLNWVLDAPPAEVFRAWTDPEHLGWFYNSDNPIPTEPIELDLRVGGAWRQLMVINRSTTYVTGGVYREIVPDEKLVLAWGATGGWPELDPDRLDDSPQVTVIAGGGRRAHRDDRSRRATREHAGRRRAGVVVDVPGRHARHGRPARCHVLDSLTC